MPTSGKPGALAAEVAASIVCVELVSRPSVAEVTNALAAKCAPDDDPSALFAPLTLAGLHHVQKHPDDLRVFIRVATDFRAFLDVWEFTEQETGCAPRSRRGALGGAGGVRAHDRSA